MGTLGSLHALDEGTCDAFAELDGHYRPGSQIDEPFSLSFDKEWHLLHFALTGTSKPTDHPLGILFERGPLLEEISEDCRAISLAEMFAFNQALKLETSDTLSARFDWNAMVAEDVYCAHPDDDPDAMFLYTIQNLSELRAFAAKCVEHKCGALVVIA